MGLTNNQQSLIKAVAENDLSMAKKCAKVCLAEDATQKNRFFVNKYSKILDGLPEFIELPPNLKGKLIMEDVSRTFMVDRYYLSPKERELSETITRMKAVADKLKEKNISYINATMLSGESGTGKTTFGRYIAYKLNLPFCYINFSNIINSYMGKTSENLFLIFHYVKNNPCVLMLDEVDCIAMKRGHAGDGGVAVKWWEYVTKN